MYLLGNDIEEVNYQNNSLNRYNNEIKKLLSDSSKVKSPEKQ